MSKVQENYNKITLVITSFGRLDLLYRTFKSFFCFNTYPIEKYIIIDNSEKIGIELGIRNIFAGYNAMIIINPTNIGQVSSIDTAYSYVNTEYIFHCEDDWEFFDYGFVEKSIDVLVHAPNILNVNLRVRFDGERGSMHPITDQMQTKNGTIYHEYIPNYLGAWHGFSWNPGLRRLEDYNQIKPYKQYGEESGVGKKYFEMGRRAACLEKFYCRHIGQNSITYKRNE